MPTLDTLLIFLAAAMLLNLSPGPSNFYVMSRTIAQGKVAGYVASIGLALGSLVHVIAAAFGLSAVFSYSPNAYAALKIVGAAYLVYLGLRTFFEKDVTEDSISPPTQKTYRNILLESALVEITNPKTALFFLALLPQFVDISLGDPAPQLLLLGLIVTLSAIPCDLFVAIGTNRAAQWMSGSHGFKKNLNRISGGILVGLGLYVFMDENKA